MLIWLNGPFGGGKTQTAYELARRLPGSVVSDPEEIGYGLHRALPRAARGDFQDLAAWRAGVVETLDRALTVNDGPVIVPMTVVRDDYFAETVGRLRELGHDVRHFALLADREVVLRRLRERVVGHAAAVVLGRAALRQESFAVGKLDECLTALQRPEYAEHVHTDHLDIVRVADAVARSCGLTLTPNTDGRVRRRLRRLDVGLRHVRLR